MVTCHTVEVPSIAKLANRSFTEVEIKTPPQPRLALDSLSTTDSKPAPVRPGRVFVFGHASGKRHRHQR